MDFLQREEAPLSAEEWEAIDRAVLEVARSALVCRRFVPLRGPAGAGHQVASYDVVRGTEPGVCEVEPGREGSCEPVRVGERRHVPIPTIYKDFVISWRDLEHWRSFNLGIDTSAVSAATSALCVAEDRLVLFGNSELGIEGLLTARGVQEGKLSDWSSAGSAFSDIVRGISLLVERGFYTNYYVVMNPKRYFLLNRIHGNTGLLEIEQVKKLVRDVLQTPVMPEDKVLIVSSSPANFDLFVALDISVAYVESTNMNHVFRVMEMVVPRVKRPESVVVLSG
ncbi:MAG: DUF2184 domain-containing protein [Aquificae bacterium]|nr:DUF2184 domain-containing protein [Aquificota bacterium]